jgi:gas vesicle protein
MQDFFNESNVGKGTVPGMNAIGLIIGGIGVGALLMYLLDPDRGRGRRSRLSDQLTSKVNRFGRAAGSKVHDLRNRAEGVMHEVGLVGETRDSNTSARSTTDENYHPVGQRM